MKSTAKLGKPGGFFPIEDVEHFTDIILFGSLDQVRTDVGR